MDDDRDRGANARLLLERHPRATWREGRSGAARFWLEVHDGFRQQCGALRAANDGYRAGGMNAHAYAALVAPLLRAMLAHVDGHHRVEDYHYFPVFRTAEPRLTAGFDALEADHERLRPTIDTALVALEELWAAVHSRSAEGNAERHAAELYAAASERLCRHLLEHLAAEEDIVIPLLIERSAEPG